MRPLLVLALALASVSVCAQTYRWVDPATGRTVISDNPPPPKAKGVVRAEEEAPSGGSLPYATRRAAENFPVTLYTAPQCESECRQARDLLKGRGVPFQEVMVQKPEEAEQVKKLIGEFAVPALKVGKQSLKGFQAQGYNDILDAAGYPNSSFLGSKAPSGAAK